MSDRNGSLDASPRWPRCGGLALSLAGCTVNPATGRLQLHRLHVEPRRRGSARRAIPRCSRSSAAPMARPSVQRYDPDSASCSRRPRSARRPIHLHGAGLADRQCLRGAGRLRLHHARAAGAGQQRGRGSPACLAHEIGHIVARHSAQRYSQGVLAQTRRGRLGVVTGSERARSTSPATAPPACAAELLARPGVRGRPARRALSRRAPSYDPQAMAASSPAWKPTPARGDARGQSRDGRPVQHHADPSAHDRPRRARDRGREGGRRRSPTPSSSATSISTRSTACSMATTPSRASSRAGNSRIRSCKLAFTAPQGFQLCAMAAEAVLSGLGPQRRSHDLRRRPPPPSAAAWRLHLRTSGRRSIRLRGLDSRSRSTAWRRRPRLRRWIHRQGQVFVRLVAIRYRRQHASTGSSVVGPTQSAAAASIRVSASRPPASASSPRSEAARSSRCGCASSPSSRATAYPRSPNRWPSRIIGAAIPGAQRARRRTTRWSRASA